MKHLEDITPVRRGTWLYSGSLPCEVRIVPYDTLYGSGDYEDSPEISEDRKAPCFYVLFQTPTGEPSWVGGGAALSIAEAVSIAEAKLGGAVVWHD
jgi:hypothetical protein